MPAPALLISAGAFLLGFVLGSASNESEAMPALIGADRVLEKDKENIEQVSMTFLPHVEHQITALTETSDWQAEEIEEAFDEDEGFGFLSDLNEESFGDEAPADWEELFDQLPNVEDAVALYFTMQDEDTPVWVKALVASTLLYLMSPLDAIDDKIPGLGHLDDATIISWTYDRVSEYVTETHRQQAHAWLEDRGGLEMSFQDLVNIRIVAQDFLSKAAQSIANGDWQNLLGQTPGLTEAVSMYFAMVDPTSPVLTKVKIAGSLIYLFSPADIIPDVIPVIGQMDDIGVILYAFNGVRNDVMSRHMNKARAWLEEQGVDAEPIIEMPSFVMPHSGE